MGAHGAVECADFPGVARKTLDVPGAFAMKLEELSFHTLEVEPIPEIAEGELMHVGVARADGAGPIHANEPLPGTTLHVGAGVDTLAAAELEAVDHLHGAGFDHGTIRVDHVMKRRTGTFHHVINRQPLLVTSVGLEEIHVITADSVFSEEVHGFPYALIVPGVQHKGEPKRNLMFLSQGQRLLDEVTFVPPPVVDLGRAIAAQTK